MSTSLAQQLAQNVSLNVTLLVDRTRRKATESYLFTGKEADQHDLDSVHALGTNAFLQLATLEPSLRAYETKLFSDSAKAMDRTLQSAAANAELDATLEGFLPLLGPFLLEIPTGKVIEWLVRRFRINEFNVRAVLRLFFPYYESPHFLKMLSILHITEESPFAALLPYKKMNTKLTRVSLVTAMLQSTNTDLARFVAGLLPAAVHASSVEGLHRALIAFHTGILFDFVKQRQDGHVGKSMDEGTATWFLASALEPMQTCATIQVESSKDHLIKEVILSSFLLLSALSHTTTLSSKALSTILKCVMSCAARIPPKHLIRSLVAICAGQLEFPPSVVSKAVSKAILQLEGIEEDLKQAVIYSGSEKFLSGLVVGLVPRLRDDRAFTIVLSLLPLSELPPEVVSSAASSLIARLTRQADEGDTVSDDKQTGDARVRTILIQIQQRYPSILQSCFDSAMQEDSEKKGILEQALLSLSLDLPTSSEISKEKDAVIASASTDTNLRAIAVHGLYTELTKASISDEERASVESALFARIHDTQTSVLEALYAEPATFLPVALRNLNDYIQTLSRILHPAPKNVVKLHSSFIATHLYPALSTSADQNDFRNQIFYHLFFPFLLLSKPRQKVTNAVWEILDVAEKSDDSASIPQYELLAGCVDVFRWQDASASTEGRSDRHRSPDLCANINLGVAGRIAENLAFSKSLHNHSLFFLGSLQDENVYTRALAFLVLRELLGRLSGEQQINLALRVTEAIGMSDLAGVGELFVGIENVPSILEDENLGHATYAKPSSRNTLHRLQSSLLIILPTLPRPSGTNLNWVNAPPALSDSKAAGPAYVQLMQAVYQLANSSSNAPSLSSHLICSLFTNLGEDALSFLTGFWLSRFPEKDFASVAAVSLHHASAFLEAHHVAQSTIDFQTVLPAVLVALQHSDARVREAALQCIAALSRLCQGKKPTAVYAFDAIYGPSSSGLLYLDWPDFSKYIEVLKSAADHFLNDATYLRIFHRASLGINKADSKKEAGFKQRVLRCLLSHILSFPGIATKVSLLQIIEGISSATKGQMLLPVIEGLIGGSGVAQDGEAQGQYTLLLLSSLDGSFSGDLNDTKGDAWGVYKSVLRHFFQTGSQPSARAVLSDRLCGSILAGLRPEHKLEVCQLFLRLGQDNLETADDCILVLKAIVSDVEIIVQLLSIFSPSSDDGSQRASKRTKTDSSVASTTDSLSTLTLLAEVMNSKTLPGSVELISSLLATLSKVVHDATSPAGDKVFLEQMLMSALEGVAGGMPDGSGLPSTIRLDILVELIRASENPQTFNQALLLTATLARLAPNAVLQNIMPIFTFMGSNVFHRDDTYSFGVVQKTIESIVPVMASYLRDNNPDRLEMLIAARSFLQIFTDAANHIPRHRRISFFTQLIGALGASDFVAPVCMLLVDKVHNRVARQNPTDARGSLFLPLSILERYPTDVRVQTIIELLHEARRLVRADSNPPEPVKRFLEVPVDDESTSSVSVVKRQASSILSCAGHALQGMMISSESDNSGVSRSSKIISLLLDFVAPKSSKAPEDGVAKLARTAIENALQAMFAKEFVQSVLVILQSGILVQDGVLELLASQLEEVATETRSEVNKTIVKIVEHIRKLLTTTSGASTTTIACFRAVEAIAATMCPGEESALTNIVPISVNYIQDGRCVPSALAGLRALTGKLGPRVIPYFKDIVTACIDVLQSQETPEDTDDEPPPVVALNILQTLLSSIPKFWGNAQLLQVIGLYLEHGSPQLVSLTRAMSKKAQAKVLLPLLCEVWSPLSSSPAESIEPKLERFFDFFKRCIRSAHREAVLANHRVLSKAFLEAFQVCASAPLLSAVRDGVITAFIELVLKLNEPTFKPLFRKMVDWAFASDSVDLGEKRPLVFIYVFSSILDHFKGLMMPYMSFLLQPILDILNKFKGQEHGDESLWLVTMMILTKSFLYDEEAFYDESKFQQLIPALIAQIAVAPGLHSEDTKAMLSDCLIALTEVVQNDKTLKTINLDILMHTRSEDARTRVFALSCSDALWESHGGKLMGFVSETATFIAESAEDVNDTVVKEAHRLKNTVEALAGKIDV